MNTELENICTQMATYIQERSQERRVVGAKLKFFLKILCKILKILDFELSVGPCIYLTIFLKLLLGRNGEAI